MQLPRLDRRSAITLLRRAVALGVIHIDTAGYYGPARANEFLRAALAPYPGVLVIVTKVGYRLSERDGLVPAQAPGQLRAGVEAGLRCLGIAQLPVVNLRLEDPASGISQGQVNFDVQVAEMADMRDEGLVGAFGISNAGIDHLGRAVGAGAVCCQNAYSVLNRRDEPLLEVCGRRGMAWVPYFPLGGSWSGSVTSHPAVRSAGEQLGATPAQVALAWLLDHAPVTLLIPGTSGLVHLEENVLSASLRLHPGHLALDTLGDPAPGRTPI